MFSDLLIDGGKWDGEDEFTTVAIGTTVLPDEEETHVEVDVEKRFGKEAMSVLSRSLRRRLYGDV